MLNIRNIFAEGKIVEKVSCMLIYSHTLVRSRKKKAIAPQCVFKKIERIFFIHSLYMLHHYLSTCFISALIFSSPDYILFFYTSCKINANILAILCGRNPPFIQYNAFSGRCFISFYT